MFRTDTGVRADDQEHAADGQRRHLLHRARSRLGGRRANRAARSGTSVAIDRRQSTRQPRRGDLQGLAVSSRRRTATWSRSTSRTAASAGASRSATSTSFYYASVAPMIVKIMVIVGVSGDDFDIPGLPPGARIRPAARCSGRCGTCRRRRAIRARRSWPNEEMAMKHGGGMTWQPVTVRSRAELHLRHHRQSAARHRLQEPSRRQPVHGLDRRAQRRHRQDGRAFPVVAARHARLGLDADRGADRRGGRTGRSAS